LSTIQATVTITGVPLPENEATGVSRSLGRCFHTGTYSSAEERQQIREVIPSLNLMLNFSQLHIISSFSMILRPRLKPKLDIRGYEDSLGEKVESGEGCPCPDL
jgi:hypothetical protein